MANILCAWEMGSHLGHLASLKPFVDSALAAGHRVTLAAKELRNVDSVYRGYDIGLFQAPIVKTEAPLRDNALSLSELIVRHYSDTEKLALRCRVWRSIFDAAQPDAVIYDYSPTALIASLGQPWKKWVIGNAFSVPRTDQRFLGLFPGVKNTPENLQRLRDADRKLLAMVNTVLESQGGKAINDPRNIFAQADRQLLMTLPEMEYFGPRQEGTYLGIAETPGGIAPSWPDGGKLKVFGYLRNFSAMEEFFTALLRFDVSLLIFGRDIHPAVRQKFPRIRFVDDPVDLGRVTAEADLVLSMGSHGTCADCFMCGVPQLMIPPHQEHLYTARRIESLGGGVVAIQGRSFDGPIAKAIDLARKGKQVFDPVRCERMRGRQLAETASTLMGELT